MKITIIGGGNMGSAIAQGLTAGTYIEAQNITVINNSIHRDYGNGIKSVVGEYSSLRAADIVLLAVKPWQVTKLLEQHKESLVNNNQLLISVVAGFSLQQLVALTNPNKPIVRVMPNTAIAYRESMNFVSSLNTTIEQNDLVLAIFAEMGKSEMIDDDIFAAATSLSGCGIAYALRYVRASIAGGVEMGLGVEQARNAVIQTLKGAVALLEKNNSYPEAEIDKITTPGGLTIKGLNELEHSGFTSAVIKALKASNM